jgi:hypothetical protein
VAGVALWIIGASMHLSEQVHFDLRDMHRLNTGIFAKMFASLVVVIALTNASFNTAYV